MLLLLLLLPSAASSKAGFAAAAASASAFAVAASSFASAVAFLYFKSLFQVNTGTEASAKLSQIILETVVGFIKHSSTLDKYRNML